MEYPSYFKAGNYNLFGVLHKSDTVEESKAGVVFCHPFAEEKVISHRVMVNCARGLAASGIPVFRFDFMGHGDSEGNFEDATIETRLDDINGAVQFFKKRTGADRIVLLGLRFGATLSAVYASRDEVSVDSIVMINPVINGKTYLKKMLRSNLATQMAAYQKILKNRDRLIEELSNGISVNVDGYLITKNLFNQINDINLEKSLPRHPDKVLIIDVSKKDLDIVDKQYLGLQQMLENGHVTTDLLRIQSEPFWSDTKHYIAEIKELHEAVMEWFGNIYAR